MSDKSQISDVDLIRLLGEYAAKADRAHQRYLLSRGAAATVMLAVGALTASGVWIAVGDFAALYFIGVLSVVTFGTLMLHVYLTKLRTTVELAVWQLRRVYELVSRREDLGLALDSGARLELELRLSEAAFILTSLERFDRPEKFQQFRRVGSDSPFRVLESDDSMLPPTTESDPETTPAAAPGYSASPS